MRESKGVNQKAWIQLGRVAEPTRRSGGRIIDLLIRRVERARNGVGGAALHGAAVMLKGPFRRFGGVEQFGEPSHCALVVLRESLECEGKHLPGLEGRAINLAHTRLIRPARHRLVAAIARASTEAEQDTTVAFRVISVREHFEKPCTSFRTDPLEFLFRNALVVANPNKLFRLGGGQPIFLRVGLTGHRQDEAGER